MIFPLAYLAGLFCLVLAHALFDPLPGSGVPWQLAAMTPLLLLPTIFAQAAGRRIHASLQRYHPPGGGEHALLGLAAASVPIVELLLLGPGTLLDLAEDWSHGSEALLLFLQVLPLLVLELSRIVAEARLRSELRGIGLAGAPTVRDRIAVVMLFTVPLLLYGAILDLTARDRGLYVFFTGTSIGVTVGVGTALLLLSALLPWFFRYFLATTRVLPAHLDADLRTTAQNLGFPPQCVLAMDTGGRMVNAMMVGPLPWPRYLVLTDGLLASLDATALRGVVAHEVGHAKAGHPGLLMLVFVVVPLLLLQPLGAVDLQEVSGWRLAIGTAVVVAVGLWLLRKVGRRFEHEADLLSAEALGGASPCITALQRVGELSGSEPDALPHGHRRGGFGILRLFERVLVRHPSESDRVRMLLRWEGDAAFRTRFHAAGRRLRTAIVVLLLGSLGLAAWSWWVSWPVERAIWLFYTGDFPAAQAQIRAAGSSVTGARLQSWQLFTAEAEAAFAIAPGGGHWAALRPQLAAEGWRRGIEVLVASGPAAARPWLSLATETETRSPLRQSLSDYCVAVDDGDALRVQRLREHLGTLDLPAELRTALRL